MDQRFLSEKQAARWLGVSRRLLQRFRTRQAGPGYVRVGGRVLYDRADLAAFVEANRVGGEFAAA